jgi:hypothetical protein
MRTHKAELKRVSITYLAIVDRSCISNQVDMFLAHKATCLLVSFQRPTASDNVVKLEIGSNLLLQNFGDLGLIVTSLLHGFLLFPCDPGTDQVVDGGRKFATTATLHEQNLIVTGNVKIASQVSLGLVKDLGS